MGPPRSGLQLGRCTAIGYPFWSAGVATVFYSPSRVAFACSLPLHSRRAMRLHSHRTQFHLLRAHCRPLPGKRQGSPGQLLTQMPPLPRLVAGTTALYCCPSSSLDLIQTRAPSWAFGSSVPSLNPAAKPPPLSLVIVFTRQDRDGRRGMNVDFGMDNTEQLRTCWRNYFVYPSNTAFVLKF
ncbi:hypothetical protein B0H12DRAFT_564903 [Mycena haematopus]|nr:hypothetical protein B0H12DRAFT_564903 [Mycena haematopus]